MGSDEMDPGLVSGIYISIHAPRMGSDKMVCLPAALSQDFNPRSPHGERRRKLATCFFIIEISIHAPRMGSDSLAKFTKDLKSISIHAPRMGSDEKYPVHKFLY